MENKIHDDRLEDYVRRSFEEYEEEPASGAWERIAGDLPPAMPFRPVSRYRWRWAAMLVVALLFTAVICQRIDYEEETGNMVNFNSIEPEGQKNDFRYSEAQHSSEKPANNAPLNMPDNKSAQNPPRRIAQSSFPALTRRLPLHDLIAYDSIQNIPGAIEKMQIDRSALEMQKSGITVDSAFIFQGLAVSALPNSIAYARNYTPERLLLPLPAAHLSNKPSGWYCGLTATPNMAFERYNSPVIRPGRPVFASKQEHAEPSIDWRLFVGKKLDKHFSIESGVGFSKKTRTAIHTPRFRFDDGTIPGGQQGVEVRDFSYDLNTYSGAATVSLRVEQVDNSPVNGTEAVTLRIKTVENVQLMRVPLLAVARLGKGRLHCIAKAGLTGNFFLKSELDISARSSQNNRFRPVLGGGSYSLHYDRPGKFFAGYWISAGAEFHWGKHLSLVAEPVLSGDFPRKNALGIALPGQISTGLNIGANYYF